MHRGVIESPQLAFAARASLSGNEAERGRAILRCRARQTLHATVAPSLVS